MDRPKVVTGATYQIHQPDSHYAIYVTINDLDGKPFEIFINSKEMGQFQWITAMTRIVSLCFRHIDAGLVVEELRNVFDPKGGYFKGSAFIPSLVAEIGGVIAKHVGQPEKLKNKAEQLSGNPEQFKAGYKLSPTESKQTVSKTEIVEQLKSASAQFTGALLCPKCNSKAVIVADGCATCMECGDSKCGE